MSTFPTIIIGAAAILAAAAPTETVNFDDAGTGQAVTPPLEHSGELYSATLSPDGRWVVTGGGWDGTVRLWDPRRAGPTIPGHNDPCARPVAPSAQSELPCEWPSRLEAKASPAR